MSASAGESRRDRLRRLRLRVAAGVATGFVALWGAVWAFGPQGGGAAAAGRVTGGQGGSASSAPSAPVPGDDGSVPGDGSAGDDGSVPDDGGFIDPGTQAAPSQGSSQVPGPVITGQS